LNPQVALQELLAGNARYVSGHSIASNPPSNRDALVEGQSPFAAIVRCADSRVAPEIVFDQPLGKLFVCGVAGNIPTPEIVDSLEFAIQYLGLSLIVIMGHSHCSAVRFAMENEFPEGIFSQITLSPTPDLDETIANNSEQGIATILNRSYFIEDVVKKGAVQIVAGVQDIASGEFDLVAQTQLN
jgi:carbonic anhydrase